MTREEWVAYVRSERRRHREMLVVSALAIGLAFAFEVRPDDRVALRGLSDYPLPPSCLSNQLFGVRCPGCGLTRSFVFLAHGDLRSSLSRHRLGWLLFAVVVVQIPYRFTLTRRPARNPLGVWLPRLTGYALIALLVVNWLLEIVLT